MNQTKYITMLVGTTFLMGIAFPIGKIGLDYAPPFLLMSFRYLIAGVLLVLITRRRQQPRGKQWLQAAAIGLLQTTGVMGCAYFSMRWITSSESAILTFVNPLLVIVLGTLLTGAVYRLRQWAGVAVGFLGVAVTFGLHVDLSPGTFICLAGAVCFASATLLIKRWGAGFDMNVLAAYQMLSGGIVLLALSFIAEKPVFTVTSTSVIVVLSLALFCSIVQFTTWYHLLKQGDAAKTSSFLFLAPLFGVLCSWLMLGEQLHLYTAIGGALICTGIFLVNREGAKTTHQHTNHTVAQ
ncbi:threonine/homoserine efflux transporter RhtA [Paenibacillus cellulosilyticus]|uniref:Threonine/homoserine efflux transporter RhtA n=1 Tax=Paenibacillus cellulosilyticus TaxID=375489 RepID=A0A2V2YT31_9BACL|nr:EamA family transporter [Paenibacillus cellulosilyticus]PWV98431.1 threonine/homoserine efflux transporter RhtA [Paenibacillus cellulosilyticus]QKS43278.1 EamA family transporter [Paenibacillus cellulosilyticus]